MGCITISKRVFQENKARQIFRKMNISYPLIHTYVCASGGKKSLFFGKFGVLCVLVTSRFEIRPFALLPTNYVTSLVDELGNQQKRSEVPRKYLR